MEQSLSNFLQKGYPVAAYQLPQVTQVEMPVDLLRRLADKPDLRIVLDRMRWLSVECVWVLCSWFAVLKANMQSDLPIQYQADTMDSFCRPPTCIQAGTQHLSVRYLVARQVATFRLPWKFPPALHAAQIQPSNWLFWISRSSSEKVGIICSVTQTEIKQHDITSCLAAWLA